MGITDMRAPMSLGGQHDPHSHWSRSRNGFILLKALKLHVVTEKKWNDSQYIAHKAIIIHEVLHRKHSPHGGQCTVEAEKCPSKGFTALISRNDRDELDNENVNF